MSRSLSRCKQFAGFVGLCSSCPSVTPCTPRFTRALLLLIWMSALYTGLDLSLSMIRNDRDWINSSISGVASGMAYGVYRGSHSCQPTPFASSILLIDILVTRCSWRFESGRYFGRCDERVGIGSDRQCNLCHSLAAGSDVRSGGAKEGDRACSRAQGRGGEACKIGRGRPRARAPAHGGSVHHLRLVWQERNQT
jgi:hypothetical protein